ncbi:tetratricopeptide repeat protein [Treponema pectinovorum]|uniref:tetratricopeptide repeat protein n=1 Tax=Treponema pectinovorum TaxID=164 RepID=UPI0011CA9D69|nr:hypothetical protein [Treponema pectinovorum]
MKKKHRCSFGLKSFTCAFILIGFFFISCSDKSEVKSFLSSLDAVDSFIENAEPADALKLLKKTSKSAYSSYARLGIYKRYMTLGEKKLAEKTLVSALSKLPQNLEISAVYSQFLLREKRLEEALKISHVLVGTKYASIHSECVLKSNTQNDYFSKALSSVYKDCYVATKNYKWLIDAALPLLKIGEFQEAALLQDEIEKSSAPFWALVQFDAGNYDLCVENLEKIDDDNFSNFQVSLFSDAYTSLGDYEAAQQSREKWISLSKERGQKISALVYVNSALWAYERGEYSKAYDFLTKVVMEDPQNIPALLTYGKFAWQDAQIEQQDMLESALRKTKLRSYSMQQKDERPKFLMSDARYRIDSLIEEQKKQKIAVDDDLLVEQLELFLKDNLNLPATKLDGAIWKTLELNEISGDMYPPKLVNFAVSTLLKYSKVQDARELFAKYLYARYKMTENSDDEKKSISYDVFGGEKKYFAPEVPDFVLKAAFGDRASEYANRMENWEIEMAAYFSLIDENFDAAKRLYEYVLFETGSVKKMLVNDEIYGFSPLAKVSSAVNLACLYSSSGELKKALSLYGLASGRTRNKKLKSLILYRSALVQKDMDNIKGAILSLDYALSLDPLNVDAKVLRTKLK